MKWFVEGGAQIAGTIAKNLSDVSIKNAISPEEAFPPKYQRKPVVDKEKLSQSPKVYIGIQSDRDCKLILNPIEGEKMIKFVNESIVDLKGRLIDTINELTKYHEKRIDELRKLLTLDQSKEFDMYEYIDALEAMIIKVKASVKEEDELFRLNVNELVKGYNEDKKGLHPPSIKESIFKRTKDKIVEKLNLQIKPIKEREIDTICKGTLVLGKEKEVSCNITHVHLSKGYIHVVYTENETKHRDKDIYFKNLCIMDV